MERYRLTKEKPRQRVRLRQRKPANRKQLTVDKIRKLVPKKDKQYLVWDSGTDGQRGLCVLVSPKGAKSFRCCFYFDGSWKPHFMHLGRVDEGMTLEEARELAKKARKASRSGIDPRSDDPNKSDSFERSVRDWVKYEQIGSAGNKSALETQNMLLKACADWLPRSVATIRPQEIERLLWEIRDGDADKGRKPYPYKANRLHSHLRSLFNWCARPSGNIKHSPMTGMKPPFQNEQPRDLAWFKGHAADNAISKLWLAADEIGGDEGRFVKCMLLMGKRRGALSAMKWEEIDDSWYWNAPKSDSNKKLFGQPLSPLAQRVLGKHQGQGPVFGELNKRGIDRLQAKLRKLSGIDDFIWHGCRHVAETRMGDIGILPHVKDMLLDHVAVRGSGKAYDHGTYRQQMTEAVDKWATHVEGLVEQRQGVTRLR
jgi:integrase